MIPIEGKKYIYKGLQLIFIHSSIDAWYFTDGKSIRIFYNLDGIIELKKDTYSAIREIKGILSDFSDDEQLDIISSLDVLASEIRDKKPIYYASSGMQ